MKLSVISLVYVCASAISAAPILKKRDPDLDASRCPDFCAGTNQTSPDPNSICGDRRLGPVTLPTGLPLEGIAGVDSIYRRFGGDCPGAFLAKWTNPATGEFNDPPYNGYSIDATGKPATFNLTLETGTFLDRFGSEFGTYMSPAGASYAHRSLPPTNLVAAPGGVYPYNYRVYMVSRSLIVQAGPIAGWFGQQGLGLQFFMPQNIMTLVDQGFLTRVNLTADPNW